MIIAENVGNGRVRRHSDKGVLLHKIGTDEYYADPVDLVSAGWTYEESDMSIPTEDDEPSDDFII